MLVNASFTASEISWRCSSTLSSATVASLRAASVAARVLPKSNRSWESATWAKSVWFGWRSMVTGEVMPVVGDVERIVCWLRVAPAEAVSWGSIGASAWVTR